jgi:exopolysaccharide biosynthesis polyprenyl glycosylphosphotransferase
MQSNIKDKIALLAAGDFLAMLMAVLLALFFGDKRPFSEKLILTHIVGSLTLIFTALVIFFIIDTYSLHRSPLRLMRQSLVIILGLILSAIATTFIFFFFRDAVPRRVFLLFYLFSATLIITMRYFTARQAPTPVCRMLIIGGCGGRSKFIEDLIIGNDYLCSHVVGLISDIPESQKRTKCPQLGGIKDLFSVISTHKIHTIIVASKRLSDDLARLLVECMQMKVRVASFSHTVEEISGQIPITYLDDNWFILELGNQNKRYFWLAKRYIDIGIALVGIVLSLPMFLVAALAIKLESSGPVFFFQLRAGRDNKPFKVWKLRTMIDGADQNNVHWTLDNDDRITKVGRFLRKMRFDEVPQLINMLKGDMSLIGPRPEAVSLVEKYIEAIPYYLERHMVSPGITGWAQINYHYGNSIDDTRQKLMYDFYYIKNRSAMLDTIIFLRTIRTVLTGKGAM